MPVSSRVSRLLQGMSRQEKVGQLLIFTWKNEQQAENDLRFHPAGYIRIYSDAVTVARQTAAIQPKARIPLIIAADLERGIGGTIGGALEVVTCMALGAVNSEKAAYDAAHMIGKEAGAMGINMNYAPVLDVNSNASNPVINTRSFGANPYIVAKLGVAFAQGLQDAGVIPCGKHFPGHGDSAVDSHSQLGSVNGHRDRLEAVELVPFRAAIAAGIDAIMSAHLRLPAIEPDDVPATLSKKVMTGLLREELGFQGLIVSDALDMGAVANNFPPAVALPMAINAGCDQLIMPQDNEAAYMTLLEAVDNGLISEARLDEAVGQTLSLKEKYGILDYNLREFDAASLYQTGHIGRAREIARESVTLVSNDGTIPLKKEQRIFCLLFSNGGDSRSHFLEPESFADYLASDGWLVRSTNLAGTISEPGAVTSEILNLAQASDVILLAAYVNIRLSSGTIALPEQAVENLKPLTKLGKPVILVSFGSPYIGTQFSDIASYSCAYGATQPSQEAMAAALKGEISFNGKLPIQL